MTGFLGFLLFMGLISTTAVLFMRWTRPIVNADLLMAEIEEYLREV